MIQKRLSSPNFITYLCQFLIDFYSVFQFECICNFSQTHGSANTVDPVIFGIPQFVTINDFGYIMISAICCFISGLLTVVFFRPPSGFLYPPNKAAMQNKIPSAKHPQRERLKAKIWQLSPWQKGVELLIRRMFTKRWKHSQQMEKISVHV